MRVLSNLLIILLVLTSIYSYSRTNFGFNEIENKINYLNLRMNFLFDIIENYEEKLFQVNSILYKKDNLTTALEERLDEVASCGHVVKTRSADFRLYKWRYTLLHRLKSKEKHIKHEIMKICCEMEKTCIDERVAYLLGQIPSLEGESCHHTITSIYNTVERVERLKEYYDRVRKVESELIAKIDCLRSHNRQYANEFNRCCCWV